MPDLEKFVVTFVVKEHFARRKWTATYVAKNFGDAEYLAEQTLERNKDKDSEIDSIERW